MVFVNNRESAERIGGRGMMGDTGSGAASNITDNGRDQQRRGSPATPMTNGEVASRRKPEWVVWWWGK